MSAMETIIAGAALWLLLQPSLAIQPKITQPTQGQTIRPSSFPYSLIVKGQTSSTMEVSLYAGGVAMSTITANGNFSVPMTVRGPGPHSIKWSTLNGQGQRIGATIDITIADPTVEQLYRWEELHGVNWISHELKKKEDGRLGGRAITRAQIQQAMEVCRINGFNLLRLVVYQETWERYPSAVESEIDEICTAADAKGIKIIFDPHQWHIGGNAYTDSIGFPSKYLAGYNITGAPGTYDDRTLVSPDAVQWWRDFWQNNLRNFPNAWADMVEFHKRLIALYDNYDSVIGYEIMNEPQSTQDIDYERQGEFNTFMAAEMMKTTEKLIVFCRDNGIGTGATGSGNNSLRHKLIPRNVPDDRLVYDSHRYAATPEAYKTTVSAVLAGRPNIKVWMGEYRPVSWSKATNSWLSATEIKTRMKGFLQPCHDNNWASAFWAFGGYDLAKDGQLVDSTLQLLPPGIGLRDAITEVYGQ